MLAGLVARFKRLLTEIVSISHGIRFSALDYTNEQNISVSERLRDQLETIRVSADTILQAFTKASLIKYSLDERIDEWLASKGPHVCLEKLREMNDILGSGHLSPTEDKLSAAMSFFDNHKSVFHFLLTPDAWNRERVDQPEASQVDVHPTTNVGATGHENGVLSDVDQTVVGTDRKKEHLYQKLDEISRWLTPTECKQKHTDALRLRQEGTCKWFANTDAYKRWREPGNRFLWLHGKAGCGKSVLIAYTIERLKKSLEKEEVVAFFYCDFQNKRSTYSTELMRSLLSQLLRHVRDHGIDPGDFPDKILKQKSEATLSLDDLKKLGDLVSRAASFFRYEPMIVIDALDECADIETLLPVLVTLSQSDVRLLVTSRKDEIIMQYFAGLRDFSFENVTGEIAADIALHIGRELHSRDRLRSAVPVMKTEIEAKLTEKAEGRFRWVQCQLDTLNWCETREEMNEALDSLPNELGATYERILGAIDERKSDGGVARRVLAMLMVALEPLLLVQIVDGLSVDLLKRDHDHDTQLWLETKLLHSLSSLVSYDEETDVLALSHYSVKEYLTGRSALPMYQLALRHAHAMAVQMCMDYLSFYLQQESSHGNLERFPMVSYVFSSGFDHLAYVGSESSVALEALQSHASEVWNHPSHWDRLCRLREDILEFPYAPWPSSKHDFVLSILIAYSPPGLLQTFLSCRCLQPRIRTNPLVYAADLRKTEHAMILLAYGADVDARGFVTDDSYCTSPLEAAINLGDDVLVGELLQRGCLITSELLSTAACMPWCSTLVLAKLVQTDEFVEWAFGIGEEELYRSVFSAARPTPRDSMKADEDHIILARRLRQFGLDLSAESPFGKELTKRALRAAHTSMLDFLLPPDQPPLGEFLIAASTGDTSETVPVVRLLLEKGVNVHAVSYRHRDTALHLAAMCPSGPRSLELTRLLINAGCDPHALNAHFETPLVVAVKHGHCSVAELLLSFNVRLPYDILFSAMERRWNLQMIELLLDSGANVHAISSSGDTILHRAIIKPEQRDAREDQESESFHLVKCFLKAGCHPTARNSAGETALKTAMWYGFASVLELLLPPDIPPPPDVLSNALGCFLAPEVIEGLLHRGADVHYTLDGNTGLHFALHTHYTEEMCRRVVERLINAGCNLTARNSIGTTALGAAIGKNFISVVELLLRHANICLPPNAFLDATYGLTPEMTEYLLQRGANVHCTTSDGDTVLHLALRGPYKPEETCYKVVERLINAGCDPTPRNFIGETPLETAIRHNFTTVVELLLSKTNICLPPNALTIATRDGLTLDMVKYLIQGGIDVCSTTSNGDTGLHLALQHNRVSVRAWTYDEVACYKAVKALIDAGCDPTAHNFARKTALEMAIERNLTSVVKLLLSLRAEVRLPPDALLIAAQHLTPEMADFLIQGGVDVHSTTSEGDTVLHLTLTLRDCYDDEEVHNEIMETLVNAGCRPTVRNCTGETALDIAIKRNFTSVVELLLFETGVHPPPDALLIAAQEDKLALELAECLIQRGADVCCTTSNGDTALHLTLQCEHYDEGIHHYIVKRLIDAGCDPTLRNSTGKTAMQIAIKRSFISVVDLLLSFDGVSLPPDALLIAAWQHSTPEMVEYLVQRGADVGSTTCNGNTALHTVLAHNEYDGSEEMSCKLVKILVNAGCDSTICNSRGEIVLDIAMRRNFTSVVEVLLPSDVPLPPDILLIAISQGSAPAMVEYLIHKGADLCSTTSCLDTALHLALGANYYPEETCCGLMKILIDAGCDATAHNYSGKTALEIAMQRNFTSAVEILLPSDVPLPPDVLLSAILQGSAPEMVEYLIRRGADLHPTTSSQDTALHLALSTNDYHEETCCKLVKILMNAGCDATTRNSTGKSALELALQRNFTSAVDILLPSDVALPPSILLIALGQCSTLKTIEYLIQRGADVHSTTPDGNTVLHAALATHRTEKEHCKLMRCLISAGCNPSACNSKGQSALLTAIERDYSLVVEVLLSFDIPIPPDILHIALCSGCKPQMVQVLMHKLGANNHLLQSVPRTNWDTLLQPTHTAYSGQYSQEITEILRVEAVTVRTPQNSEVETHMHTAKRRRLDG